MIIKSHIRGGFTAMAQYLKDQGLNEKVRVVEISDGVKTLDEAFHRMWEIGSDSKATKPIHHVSINPMKDERLTDKQVLAIIERLEEKYGYKQFQHQRVIVEHVKDGRQHFHVVWNRVSLQYGTAVWPGMHWKKSKEAAKEMRKELGLKEFTPRGSKRAYRSKNGKIKNYRARQNKSFRSGKGPYTRRLRTSPGKQSRTSHRQQFSRVKTRYPTTKGSRASSASGRYSILKDPATGSCLRPRKIRPLMAASPSSVVKRQSATWRMSYGHKPYFRNWRHWRRKKDQNIPDSEKLPFRRPEWDTAELLAWAWETKNFAVLASFGIHIEPETFEP